MATASTRVRPGDGRLATQLREQLEGEVLFDASSRGRYSTDASIYQVEPIGVVTPKRLSDIDAAMTIAREYGVPVLPRGAGTSQCGQTVGEALVIDTSKHLNRIKHLDLHAKQVTVEPGIVLDELNAQLRQHGLFFPVDVSPSNRATIGGMSGNNSCGSRSIRYGNMVHNVSAIDAVLADGEHARFADVPANLSGFEGNRRYIDLVQSMRAIGAREKDEIAAMFPKLLRRVGGYNLDTIDPSGHNAAKLLVGSEGTLAFFTGITLDLATIPTHRVLGVCHFSSFYEAMQATAHIVELNPSAVELVDHTLMGLARDIDMFRPTLEQFVRGDPRALLLVEFAGDEQGPLLQQLRALDVLMADLGHVASVVNAIEPEFQRAIWDVRKAGLNIMMSMKGEGKPVSFIEDCAVQLSDLAEYTRRLDEVFAKHGTTGTWYAHASVGTLHVRPILNLKKGEDVRKMRAIAEECFAMVREYKGSHSGEHGDGLVRSEFHEVMFGERLTRAFEDVKNEFDPHAIMNPGKIVRAERMDNRELFRYKPDYQTIEVKTKLDWSAWGGFAAAVEMCNNNGACRKRDASAMCPSYRVTMDEKHVTRGRANTLRLALSGQLGTDALTSDAVHESLALCVSCKACKRECPTGVDMARMKIEVAHLRQRRYGLTLKEKLVAHLPRYAPYVAMMPKVANLRNRLPWIASLMERALGIAAERSLPHWRSDYFRDDEATDRESNAPVVALFVDTFTRWFEPENARATVALLKSAGYAPRIVASGSSVSRPLCCGRTLLASGLVAEAKVEARRLVDALAPYARDNVPIVGLEPSCLLGLRDEIPALLQSEDAACVAENSKMLEEFIVEAHAKDEFSPRFSQSKARKVLIHGHCHQKAFGVDGMVAQALAVAPEIESSMVRSSCCGMAGAFGYDAQHVDVSKRMAEQTLLPAVRNAEEDTLLVANGTSCRHQILDGSGRHAVHLAKALADML